MLVTSKKTKLAANRINFRCCEHSIFLLKTASTLSEAIGAEILNVRIME